MSKLAYFITFTFGVVTVADALQGHGAKRDADYLPGHDPGVVHPGFPLELGFFAIWESHYVSEGRDNLDGDSLASAEATIGYSGFELGAWAAESPDRNYTECNYWLGYSYEWREFTLSVSYTFLDFVTDDTDDEEYSVQVTWALPQDFELILSGYYSVESAGAFYEVGLSKSFELTDSFTLSPFGTLGYNSDYIAEGHNGWNHLTLGLETVIEFDGHFSLSGFLAGNLEINSDEDRYPDDEPLKDFLYIGLNLSYSY